MPHRVLLGTLIGTAFVALVGLFVAKKRGIYFALLSIAFSQMFWFITWQWDTVTGGEDGLAGVNRTAIHLPGLPSIDLNDVTSFYFFVFVVFVICTLLIWTIVHSPFGRTPQAIRFNETRAKCIGYNTPLYKWLAFTVSCAFAGLGRSALYAPTKRRLC